MARKALAYRWQEYPATRSGNPTKKPLRISVVGHPT